MVYSMHRYRDQWKLILLFCLISYPLANCKRAVYLIGDSTNARMYIEGLSPHFNCHVEDKEAVKSLEILTDNPVQLSSLPYSCDHPLVSRIGFAFHWGVSPTEGSYAHQWTTHRTPGDSLNSVTNIYTALTEFQNRSRNDEGAIFFFNSNFWDASRFTTLSDPVREFVSSFKANFTTIVTELKRRLRPHDHLVLVISHAVSRYMTWKEMAHFLNIEIMKVAITLGLPTLRSDLIAGLLDHTTEKSYLVDSLHQGSDTSKKIAISIESYVEHIRVNNATDFEFEYHCDAQPS